MMRVCHRCHRRRELNKAVCPMFGENCSRPFPEFIGIEARLEDPITSCWKPSSSSKCSNNHDQFRDGDGSFERRAVTCDLKINKIVLSEDQPEKVIVPTEGSKQLIVAQDGSSAISSTNKEFDNTNVIEEVTRQGDESQCPICSTITKSSMTETRASTLTDSIKTSTTKSDALETATSPFTSAISTKNLDAEDALDRLLHDLSGDELSMVIEIFGSKLDSKSSIESQSLPETGDSESDSLLEVRSSTHQENFPCPQATPFPSLPIESWNTEESIVRRIGGSILPRPLPESLCHHSMVDSLGFDTNETRVHSKYCTHRVPCLPSPGEVTPPSLSPLTQETNNTKLQRHVPLSDTPAFSAALPATLGKEEQNVQNQNVIRKLLSKKSSSTPTLRKDPNIDEGGRSLPSMQQNVSNQNEYQQLQSKKPPMIPYLAEASNIDNRGRSRSSAPPLKKRNHVLLQGISSSKCALDVATAASQSRKLRKKPMLPAEKESKAATQSQGPKTSVAAKKVTESKAFKEDIWNQRLNEAREFISEHGHGRIPIIYLPNPDLASWAKRQRYYYRVFKKLNLDQPNNSSAAPLNPPKAIEHKNPEARSVRCLMTAERLSKLEAIGFCLDPQEESWERNYELLCNYAKINNGRTSPSKHNHYDLWKWVATQRHARKKREKIKSIAPHRKNTYISSERIAKLNDINFAWSWCDSK